jgi:hypothetical protein
MIDAEDIGRAERMLSIIYRDSDIPRQLRDSEVDMDSFNNFLMDRTAVAEEHHKAEWRSTKPGVHQAYNSLLMHFFLVGLTIGRQETRT